MLTVKLKWGSKKWKEFTFNPNDTAETLKAQLFTLTNVPVERQKVMCKGAWKGTLTDDTDLSKCKFKPNKSQIVLVGSADTVKAVEKTVFIEDLTTNEQATLNSLLPPGLNNLGNTCYMNSTLQCLRGIPELNKVLNAYNASGKSNAGDMFGSFTRNLGLLYNDMANKFEAVTPMAFVSSMRQTFTQFAERGRQGGYMQQDAEELLGALFTALKSSLKKSVIGKDCEKILGSRDNAVDAIFGIEFEQEDRCQETDAEPAKVTLSLDYKLRVNIDGGSSSTDKVDHMFQGMHKALKGQIEKNAPSLNRNAIWNRTQKINQLPKILCVQYMRFYWKKREPTQMDPSTGTKCKMLRPVAFQHTIDMYEFCSKKLQAILKVSRDAAEAERSTAKGDSNEGEKGDEKAESKKDSDGDTVMNDEDAELAKALAMSQGDKDAVLGSPGINLPTNFQGEYELFALVSHKGRSADSGHYIGWVRQEGDNWICFDDDQVDECKTSDVLLLKGGGDRDMGYLLFYRAKK
jgi:ubiquitin carboxyl-terminal hydrolase 14